MKINTLLFTLMYFFFLSCNSSGQVANKKTGECNCNIAFIDMVSKLENNYIGLKQMQISGKDEGYKDRKRRYEEMSIGIVPENCTEFLNDFLHFFNDGHLSVFERPNHSETDLLEFKNRIKGTKLIPDSLEQRPLSGKESIVKKEKDIILGKWTDGESVFIVFEVDNDYYAYILKSKKEGAEAGELKAIFRPREEGYSCTYYSYNYSPIFIQGDVYKDGELLVAGHIIWKKVEYPLNVKSIDKNDLKLPTIEIIDEKNTLITIPSFIVDFQVFDDFIKDNKKLIKNSTNLIIDIRGNRGGNGVYFPLIEIYATQNMEGSQGLVLASKDNLAYFERQMEYSRKVFKPVVNRIKGNFGEIVDGPLYPTKKFRVQKSKIRNVAILTDNACASAAESFIIHSKRSSTIVKTFGSATDGMIDFTSVNSLLLNSGKQYIYFGYPTSTLHKEISINGYNKTGIIPDVPINKQEKNKIDWIINYYKN